jgi:hypothetical protein
MIYISENPGKGCFMIFCLVESSSFHAFSWECSRPGEIHDKEIDSGNNCVQMANHKSNDPLRKVIINSIN